MKTLTVWSRKITVRRQKGFFGEVEEIIAKYGDEYVIGSEDELNNPRLRVPFVERFSHRSPKRYEALRASCVTKKGEWKKDNRTSDLLPIFEAVDEDLGRSESANKTALRGLLEEVKKDLHAARSQAGQMRRNGDKEGAKKFERENVWPLEQKASEIDRQIQRLAD